MPFLGVTVSCHACATASKGSSATEAPTSITPQLVWPQKSSKMARHGYFTAHLNMINDRFKRMRREIQADSTARTCVAPDAPAETAAEPHRTSS